MFSTSSKLLRHNLATRADLPRPNLPVVCGRFSITGDLDFYAEYFGVDEVRAEPIEPSWNVAPTDQVLVVAERDHSRLLGSMRWGLVPHWAKDSRSIQINARVETVATAPMFRDSFAHKRCLIPADGFYEWESKERGRQPHWIYRADGHPMVFAGIWAARLDQETDAWLRTCSIITTEANSLVAGIHDRMPVMLDRPAWDRWLDRDLDDPEAVMSLITPTSSDDLMEHLVSSRVNSVKNNSAVLREPSTPETLF
jgi:putative SOS response-associated peptidase YedK